MLQLGVWTTKYQHNNIMNAEDDISSVHLFYPPESWELLKTQTKLYPLATYQSTKYIISKMWIQFFISSQSPLLLLALQYHVQIIMQ